MESVNELIKRLRQANCGSDKEINMLCREAAHALNNLQEQLLTPVQRLTKDMAKAAKTLSDLEARFLVDAYYQMQENRIRADGQIRSMEKTETPEPHTVLAWLSEQNSSLEGQIKRALEKYVESHTMGSWLYSVHGIGPVISAGLIAHIDIDRAPTAGHIWRFAGLDPSTKWEKKTKRPWNAALKVICWKAGESFVKFHNDERCFYGRLWKAQKEKYIAKNEAGGFADRCKEILEKKKIGTATEAYGHYTAGHLPPGHIHAMARRWAVKIFLAHLHDEMCRRILKKDPPLPYPIKVLEHTHIIKDDSDIDEVVQHIHDTTKPKPSAKSEPNKESEPSQTSEPSTVREPKKKSARK